MTDRPDLPPDVAATQAPPSYATVRAPRPVGTLSLIAINVAIFVYMGWRNGSAEFTADYALQWGADYAPATFGEGQLWRLVSSMFLHFNLTHIASNMLCLWYWGQATEPVLGLRRWLAAYLGMGLAASLASVMLNHDVVSAGASGAISGLLGLMVMMRLLGWRHISAQTLLINLALNVGIAFAVRVDWIAHLGGFIAGIAVGTIWLRRPQA